MAETEFKSNSHKSKEAEKKKNTESKDDVRAKLLANRSKEPKKPEKRDAKSIIFCDIGMILTELKDDVIIPGIIDLGKDMWEDMGDRIYETISGRPGSSRSRRKKKSGYHAYDGHYKGEKKSRRGNKPKKISYGRYSIYEVPCKSEAFAEDVIDAIFEQIEEYGHCSVKDYYDFADFNDWEYTDYPGDWGWEADDDDEPPFDEDDLDIETVKIDGERRYIITGFPKPTRLD